MTEILVLLSLLFALRSVSTERRVTIQTRLGPITGISSFININNVDRDFTIFKQIPFAKSPVGDLRFKKPVPYGPWIGILDATKFGPSCIQPHYPKTEKYLPNLDQSEDCLFLNIYVPSSRVNNTKRSVMVWIHGGGFTVGQGMIYDGSYLGTIGDVVVVTINYRLNVFGFFSTGDTESPGNYGLWDQKLAVEWVHYNIDSFGGDPRSVTIFGESAGGFSVALQAITPSNRGLFQRVIAQSGVSNSLFATSKIVRLSSQSLARYLNCSDQLTLESLKCLRAKPASEMFKAYIKISDSYSLDIHLLGSFSPVVDGIFIKNPPVHVMKNQGSDEISFFKSLDVIIGNCESEGSLLLDSLTPLQDKLPFNITQGISSNFLFRHIIRPLVQDYLYDNLAIIPDICLKYASSGSIQDQGQKAVDFYGDVFFYTPAVQSLNAHSINNNMKKLYQFVNKRRSILTPSENISLVQGGRTRIGVTILVSGGEQYCTIIE